jgi:hypothetical protein
MDYPPAPILYNHNGNENAAIAEEIGALVASLKRKSWTYRVVAWIYVCVLVLMLLAVGIIPIVSRTYVDHGSPSGQESARALDFTLSVLGFVSMVIHSAANAFGIQEKKFRFRRGHTEATNVLGDLEREGGGVDGEAAMRALLLRNDFLSGVKQSSPEHRDRRRRNHHGRAVTSTPSPAHDGVFLDQRPVILRV